MRIAVGLSMCALCWHLGSSTVSAQLPEWERLPVSQEETAFVAVAVDPAASAHVFAATHRVLYESLDGGQSWGERFRVPIDSIVSRIAVGSSKPPVVLVATDHGLYGSFDGGLQWSRTFQGAGEGENRCTSLRFHPSDPKRAFLGTRGGLLSSSDSGRHWQAANTPVAGRDVIHFAFDPEDPNRLYLLTSRALLMGNLATGQWQQLFTVVAVAENATEEPDASDTEEPESDTIQLRAIAVDPKEPLKLYLATSRGLRVSADRGSSWEWLPQSGLLSTAVSCLLVQAHSPVAVYAGTAKGVARYQAGHKRWETITMGLSTTRVNDLAAAQHQLWAATDQGLFRYEVAPDAFSDAEPPSAHELLANFSHEPTIVQVQEVAILYAEVHPDKIKRWRRQAALQALLPTVDFGMDRDISRGFHVDEGSFPNFQLIGTRDHDRGLDLSIKWDLGELIWNDDQTSIDVRSKLMVQLRDEIVDEVTRTYFERRRLQILLLTRPPSDQQTALEKELRLQELTALIDGLTGGYFSKSVKPDVN